MPFLWWKVNNIKRFMYPVQCPLQCMHKDQCYHLWKSICGFVTAVIASHSRIESSVGFNVSPSISSMTLAVAPPSHFRPPTPSCETQKLGNGKRTTPNVWAAWCQILLCHHALKPTIIYSNSVFLENQLYISASVMQYWTALNLSSLLT